jgi:hypothetical protein
MSGASFPKTHDLVLLRQLCDQLGLIIPTPIKQLNTLSDYGVRVRYPGDDPTAVDAQEAFDIAKSVRQFARKHLGLK